MSTIEEQLVSAIQASAELQDLIEDRVYPMVSPEENPQEPFIAYHRVSGSHLEVSEGTLDDETAKIELRCVAPVYADAKAVSESIKELFAVPGDLDVSIEDGEEVPAVGGTGDEGGILYVVPLVLTIWA